MILVSSCKTDITPQGKFFPCSIHRGKLAEEIKDKLYSSTLVLSIDGVQLIWITLDLGGVSRDFSEEVRQAIASKYNVNVDHINLGFTHTHSAPPVFAMMKTMAADEGYGTYVKEKILDNVDRCFEQGLKEVTPWLSTWQIEGYYSNRISKKLPADKEFSLIQFKDETGCVVGAAYAYACHSTVVGPSNRYVTADLAGAISRGLEQQLGVYPVCMLGAAGDMSNRLYRQGHDYKELMRVSEGILAQLKVKVPEVKLQLSDVQVEPYQWQEVFCVSKEQRLKQIEEIKMKIEQAPNADLKRVFTSALAFASNAMDETEFNFDCKGTIIRMHDLEIITMPAELFCQFGLKLKAACKAPHALFWGYSNYSVGYLYDAPSVGTTFESAATSIPAGTTEKIIDFIQEKL